MGGPVKIVIAPDKFRGSLEADEVCAAMTAGVRLAFPEAEIVAVPLADGGEGTVAALTRQAGGNFVSTSVLDPLSRPIEAVYGISPDQKTAYIEMAAASGLGLLSADERNPLLTSSYGTGQLIADALERGVSSIILGLGGSATNDGGTGIAAALGFCFLDKNKNELAPNGGSLVLIHAIDQTNVHPKLAATQIAVACDVTNPLYGKTGAAYVYGPQKGATPRQVELLDEGLRHLAKVATATFGFDVSDQPGAGAAGGAGALWFLNATLEAGAEIVFHQTQLEDYIQQADLVITGEGKMDQQTLSGKLVMRVAELGARHHIPVAALCGTLDLSPREVADAGLCYAASIIDRPMSLETAQTEAFSLTKQATFHLVRLFFGGR